MMIKRNPQYELRVLLFSLLTNVITYNGSVVPVYEAVPKGLPLPYIVIGDCTWTVDDTKDAYAEDYTINLDVFTAYGGSLDNCAILDLTYQAIGTSFVNNTFCFEPGSHFRISEWWFGNGDTKNLAVERREREELENSAVELRVRIKQVS